VSPDLKFSRQIEHCLRGSDVSKAALSSISVCASCNAGSPRTKAACVGFFGAGVSSREAVMELSSWSSKLKLAAFELFVPTQFSLPTVARYCTKLLLHRVHCGVRAAGSWKNAPHSKQNAWSCRFLGSREDRRMRSPIRKRLLTGRPPGLAAASGTTLGAELRGSWLLWRSPGACLFDERVGTGASAVGGTLTTRAPAARVAGSLDSGWCTSTDGARWDIKPQPINFAVSRNIPKLH